MERPIDPMAKCNEIHKIKFHDAGRCVDIYLQYLGYFLELFLNLRKKGSPFSLSLACYASFWMGVSEIVVYHLSYLVVLQILEKMTILYIFIGQNTARELFFFPSIPLCMPLYRTGVYFK